MALPATCCLLLLLSAAATLTRAFSCAENMQLDSGAPAVASRGNQLPYRKFKRNRFCVSTPAVPEQEMSVRVVLNVRSGSTCSRCREPYECQFWQPNLEGRYIDRCSMAVTRTKAPYTGRFTMRMEMPGDEAAAGIGPDFNPHTHFACCCGENCMLNKFYYQDHMVWNRFEPDATHIANPVRNKNNTFVYRVTIPEGRSRWYGFEHRHDYRNRWPRFSPPIQNIRYNVNDI